MKIFIIHPEEDYFLRMKMFVLHFVLFLLMGTCVLPSGALINHYKFVVKDTPRTRLCSSKKILTVNDQFPGPTLHVRQGETVIVDVFNEAKENITLHWHGVKQPRHPWWDGPEYITQCPIKPGSKFTQQILVTDEIGTLWWHSHSVWTRATVHGLLVVHPKKEDYALPFPQPHAEVPIILGEWWKSDVKEVVSEFLRKGGDPNASDALLINGQPGVLYPCSKPETFKLTVEYGKKYLLRMVNAAMNNMFFFSIAKHQITVVRTDGAYTKPLKTDYISISPGQTMDVLIEANQAPDHYYMAARVYHNVDIVPFDNTTTTAILEYKGNYTPPFSPCLPALPGRRDANASTNFTGRLRSLASKKYPIDVPLKVTTKLFMTVSVNTLPCRNNSCAGPGGLRLRSSTNNISFVTPSVSILQAYYYKIKGVYEAEYPSFPPLKFNFTADKVPAKFQTPYQNTKVKVLKYNSSVEIVLQGTNVVQGVDNPMHLHGHSFYVVGLGMGNFDKKRDPLNYNLVDPPLQNTIAVPKSGWVAIRFRANNPGVWFLHCHTQRHQTWGMEMAFIVKNGKSQEAKMVPPPSDMPLC